MIASAIVCLGALLLAPAHSISQTSAICKNIPGDPGWPTEKKWAQLNSTVGGRLIATIPAASICHGIKYNGTACNILKQGWDFPEPHIINSAEIMNAYFQNQSCNPFTTATTPCSVGNYVSYAINVSSADDVTAGIHFAKKEKEKVRLVIKNMGHDYLGKSTGKGGLSLWTHNLNSTTFIDDYESGHYSGSAMRIGAGVLAGDAYLVAHKHGHRVVGGGCPSTGIAGGYTQGGGHSFLTSIYGLAADNVLEWEVMTAAGEHLIATPTQHQDLYWALSGGGGGTFGVVLSMTVKAHKDGPVGGAYLGFDASSVVLDTFWDGVDLFHALLPAIVDTGAVALSQTTKTSFTMVSLTAPGLTQEQVIKLLSPLTTGLDKLTIPYVYVPSYSSNFFDHFAATFGPLPFGPIPVSDIVSSRLIPRSTIIKHPKKFTTVVRETLDSGHYYVALSSMNTRKPSTAVANTVLPAWRSTIAQCIVGAPWDWKIPRSEMEARNVELMERVMPKFEALTPGSGIYLNEGNSAQKNWQNEFYGENWGALSEIKERHDPEGVFYATTAVGSEKWLIDEEGRLCLKDNSGYGKGNGNGNEGKREL